jgi:hypothetical protein
MNKYNFKIQFCQRGSEDSSQIIFESIFFAPTQEKASQFADDISKSFKRHELIPDLEVRPYEVILTSIID